MSASTLFFHIDCLANKACNFSVASIMVTSGPWIEKCNHMVKNICQVIHTIDKIFSFNVFQERDFFFFQKKVKLLPLVWTNA
jgi:hypothetical protein